ncbi:hypothetical protein BJX96DRAFT_161376 [Aspergillus floccosus]
MAHILPKADTLPWSKRKRLVVCCDGTWSNATGDTFKPPTNVTRISRAISSTGFTEENGKKTRISQIVYYQRGVGTGLIGDKLGGGAIGLGLSSNVRAAYGFLADNFDDGDEIFFFGFSRGAYTARAVAGLVTRFGLLTSRGMDNFPTVYNDYYKVNHGISSADSERYNNTNWRLRVGFRAKPLERFTIKIIGVWDTVAFHDSWLSRWAGEKFELPNTALSPDVEHAFQALSLDESRNAYKPVLWYVPKTDIGQELCQVWFSGYHTDVGGGAPDPRLSNITLAWMVSQCTKDGQLSIDFDYFHDGFSAQTYPEIPTPWDTCLGEANSVKFSVSRLFESFTGHSARKPLKCEEGTTNESVHESVKVRNLKFPDRPGYWPSRVLEGESDDSGWDLKGGQGSLSEFEASKLEKQMKGLIRNVRPNAID